MVFYSRTHKHYWQINAKKLFFMYIIRHFLSGYNILSVGRLFDLFQDKYEIIHIMSSLHYVSKIERQRCFTGLH